MIKNWKASNLEPLDGHAQHREEAGDDWDDE
jgi:hypothetical protein